MTRLVLAAVTSGLVAALTLTGPSTGSAEALTGPSPGTYAGQGFDACSAPPADVMAAWLVSSPYRAVGIYIGGVNRGCAQPELTASWVSTQRSAGWHLLPIYMGLQPYCTASSKPNRFTAVDAATSGQAAADDAVLQAQALGLATGSTIFLDIEAYSTTDSICTTAVLTFQSQWTSRLHVLGFLSGFYSSLGSGVRDQVAAYGSTAYLRPDYLWFARYDDIPTVWSPDIPDSYWSYRRIKQYRGGAPESYGGDTLNVDRNQVELSLPFGDFNGDGRSDLITRQTSTGALYLYPGTLAGFAARLKIGIGWNSMNLIARLGDFNRDGHEDIIAREGATGALWLYPGTGTGFASRLKIGIGWNGMREITPVGDFDGDGYPDLLAVQTSNGSLYVYPGRGTWLGARRLVGSGWNAMTELAGAGDFNRDGYFDLTARNTATGKLALYPRTTTGWGTTVPLGSGWNSMRDLVGIGDFDRDGFNDLIAVESATGKLFRYPGRGTSFGPRAQVGSGWTTDYRPLL